MPSRFMCEEWLKTNPDKTCSWCGDGKQPGCVCDPKNIKIMDAIADAAQKGQAPMVTAPEPALPQRAMVNLLGEPIPDPPPATSATSPAAPGRRYSPAARSGSKGAPVGLPVAAIGITQTGVQDAKALVDPAWVEKLEATGLEVTIQTTGPEVTLVPKRTTQDRIELEYAEGVVLATILQAFPGAKLVGITKSRLHQTDTELE